MVGTKACQGRIPGYSGYQNWLVLILYPIASGTGHRPPCGYCVLFASTTERLNNAFEVFIFNTNLAFLYKIDIHGFEKVSAKIKLPPVGFELTTPTIKGLQGRCLNHSATQKCVEQKILKLTLNHF